MVTAAKSMRRGFSLIEMLVVVVIMAVLAAIILPKFQDQSRRAKEASLKTDLAQLRTSIATFQADTGFYPATLAALAATTAPTSGYDSAGTSQTITSTDWHGPYITGSVPNDPVANSAFTYSIVSGTVGKVSASATGNDLSGTAYSTY